MGFWGFIIGFHKQTKIIKDEETKNFKQTLSSYNGVGWWKLLFYFPGWEYFMRRVFEWHPWHASKDIPHAPAKRLGDAHVKAQEYSIHSWPMCFGGRGVSDDGKMANHHFGSILGLLLFEYISICEITLKVWLKSLDWQNGKMAKWANCFKQKSMGQILNQKRC